MCDDSAYFTKIDFCICNKSIAQLIGDPRALTAVLYCSALQPFS